MEGETSPLLTEMTKGPVFGPSIKTEEEVQGIGKSVVLGQQGKICAV